MSAESIAKVEKRLAQMERRFAEKEFDAKLDARFSKLRTDLVRWMFVFWVATVIPIAGVLVAVLT